MRWFLVARKGSLGTRARDRAGGSDSARNWVSTFVLDGALRGGGPKDPQRTIMGTYAETDGASGVACPEGLPGASGVVMAG